MNAIRSFLPLLLILCLIGLQVRSQTLPADTANPAPPTDSTPQVIDPAKKAEILKMLELTGTVKLMNQVLNQMVDTLKAQNSGLSADFWDRMSKQMDTQDLVDKMIPVYDKYYTLDDLKAINVFYQSPVGQRVLANSPQIMRESSQIGQEWGRNQVARLMNELQKEKANATPPASN